MNAISKILIILFIGSVNVRLVRSYVTVGDTFNLSNKNNSTKIIISDIFNGFDRCNHVETTAFDGINYKIFHSICLKFDSLEKYLYPQVFIDGKFTPEFSPFLFDYMKTSTNKNFGINQNYINNKTFRYGVVKLCNKLQIQSLNIEVISENDFPKIDYGAYYNLLINKTAIFRVKHDNETHYVSSFYTGACLIQIYIKDAIACMNEDTKVLENQKTFFENSIYRSHILTLDNNHKLEHKINDYYFRNNIEYSLFSFLHEEQSHQENILKNFENTIIVSVNFTRLPRLPKLTKNQSPKTPHPLVSLKRSEDIIPGDILNINELFKNEKRYLITGSALIDEDDGKSLLFSTYNYSSCHELTEEKNTILKNGKFQVFYEMVKRRNYGFEKPFPQEETTCLQLTMCSIIKKRKLHFPSTIINLTKESIYKKKRNIFKKKNIFLQFSNVNVTHLITRTEKGSCLFQMLVYSQKKEFYDSKSIFDSIPVYQGKILSTANDSLLESSVNDFARSDFRKIIETQNNASIVLKVFENLIEGLENSALINLYLEELY